MVRRCKIRTETQEICSRNGFYMLISFVVSGIKGGREASWFEKEGVEGYCLPVPSQTTKLSTSWTALFKTLRAIPTPNLSLRPRIFARICLAGVREGLLGAEA